VATVGPQRGPVRHRQAIAISRCSSAALEKLDGPLVFFGGRPAFESAKISSSPGLGVGLP
jgi:hypothetical protein